MRPELAQLGLKISAGVWRLRSIQRRLAFLALPLASHSEEGGAEEEVSTQ
jgi:hypothetical protein